MVGLIWNCLYLRFYGLMCVCVKKKYFSSVYKYTLTWCIHIKIQIHLLHYKLYTKYIRAHNTQHKTNMYVFIQTRRKLWNKACMLPNEINIYNNNKNNTNNDTSNNGNSKRTSESERKRDKKKRAHTLFLK